MGAIWKLENVLEENSFRKYKMTRKKISEQKFDFSEQKKTGAFFNDKSKFDF